MRTRTSRTGTIGLALLILVGGASAGSADPVRITSGFYMLDHGRDGQWRLQGDGFTLEGQGIADPSAVFQCMSCPPGTPVSLNAGLTLNHPFEFGATAQINGTTHPQVYWLGQFNFHSGTVPALVGPEQTLSHPPSYNLPFTFTGSLQGFLTPDFSGDPFFTGSFTGSGTAGIWFYGPSANLGQPGVLRVLYEFGDPAPVPEPGTMLLLGTGLAGAIAARRRRARAALDT